MQKLVDHQEFGGMRMAVVAHGVPGRLGRRDVREDFPKVQMRQSAKVR
jgi:hypothetical protein